MPTKYILTEEQSQKLTEEFVPLFVGAPKAERKQILRDAVEAIATVGINNATLLKLEAVSEAIFALGWMLI